MRSPWTSAASSRQFRLRVARSSRTGAMRVPGVIFAERGADPRHGRQGLRAGGQRRDAARHRQGVLRHARRALGLRLPDRRRGGVRSGRGRRRLGRRRRLRHLLRRAHACTPASRAPTSIARAEARWPTRCSARIPAGVGSTGAIRLDAGRDGRHARRRRALGGRAGLRRAERSRAHRGARADARRRARRRSRTHAKTAPARRDGHARLAATTTSRCRKSPRSSTPTSPRPSGSRTGDVVVSIHCGSRGLGHQIGTEFLKRDGDRAPRGYGIALPDRELACAPINSDARPGATSARCAPRSTARSPTARSSPTSCARCSREVLPQARAAAALRRLAQHLQGRGARVDGGRAGCSCTARARRAPSARAIPTCPQALRAAGQPVLIGGSMGTGVVHPRRHAASGGAGVRLRLPRRRPRA